MTSDGGDRVREIFKEAIELPEGDRAAFVEVASNGDEALRTRVERLLQVFDADASNLGNTEVTAITAGTRIGGQLGRFRILQQIGEGGFGEVWMAEQTEPVRRRVAIKIIKPGMDSEQVIARFEAERQALAMMEHPNIARVYDGGETDEGRPYFVMELVKGMPITEYCERKKLDLAARIDLFRQVCAGVQHAHQKGVIHRDLKPNNVLVCEVDEKPVPKVIDFGIAKALERPLTDKTLFTEFRQFIGTPEYMSPEQAELSLIDVDTRSDVYALGVMLYELLAGEPPFDPKSLRSVGFDEMRRIIREEEPPPPSSKLTRSGSGKDGDIADPALGRLGKLIRGELDWIVQRAMAKERDRRYASANELEEDLSRYLRSEPVRAGRPGRIYRAQRFVRRNRVAVSFAATGIAALLAIAVLLAIGLIVLSGNYEQLQRAQENERAASQKMEESLEARTAALRDVEAAQGRTQSALEDAERARDRAEAARTSLDDQVSAMHIQRAAGLAQSEEMQAIVQLERIPEGQRNWAWRMLRATLPKRTELAELDREIICDVAPDGSIALVLRLSGTTLRYDVISLPDKELVANLQIEDFDGVIESKKIDAIGFAMPPSMQMSTLWSTLRGDGIGILDMILGNSAFSRDGRRVVLVSGVFAYFRSGLLQFSKSMNAGLEEARKMHAGEEPDDPPPWDDDEPMSVSAELLKVFDASTGELIGVLPRVRAPRNDFESVDWTADATASNVVAVLPGQTYSDDETLAVLRVDEDEVLESGPMKLMYVGSGAKIPLAVSADGKTFAVAMEVRRRELNAAARAAMAADRRVPPERPPLDQRVALLHVKDGAVHVDDQVLDGMDGKSMDDIVSLAFSHDDRGLFMLEKSGELTLFNHADVDEASEDVFVPVFAGQALSGEIAPLSARTYWKDVAPEILLPLSESGMLVAQGSRVMEVRISKDRDDGNLSQLKVVKRFDLGDARMRMSRAPTSTEEASLIFWSDDRISQIDLGARVATVRGVDHAYPTSGAWATRIGDSYVRRFELTTSKGTVEIKDVDSPPFTVSPDGRYAIMADEVLLDITTGAFTPIEGLGIDNPDRIQGLRKGSTFAFNDGCWVEDADGEELIVTVISRGPGMDEGLDLASMASMSPAFSMANLGGLGGDFYKDVLYTWNARTGVLEHKIRVPNSNVDGGVLVAQMSRAARRGRLVAVAGTWSEIPTAPTSMDEMLDFAAKTMQSTLEDRASAIMLVDRVTGDVVMSKRIPGVIGGLAISSDGSHVACFVSGKDDVSTAQVLLYSEGEGGDWEEPIVRTNNVTDAYLAKHEINNYGRPTPVLSISPDGSLACLVLTSRVDIMALRSNTWLMSWDIEEIRGMLGLPPDESGVFPLVAEAAAFGPEGNSLNILLSDSGRKRRLMRVFDSAVPVDEEP